MALITSETSLAIVVAPAVATIPSVVFPHDGQTADDLLNPGSR